MIGAHAVPEARRRRRVAAVRALAMVLPLIGAAGCASETTVESDGPVTLVRLPPGALQPKAEADPTGRVHVVYFTGRPEAGDLFYVTWKDGSGYSAPLRVNSQAGSAVAVGSVRGAQIALGAAGRVHVAWNGSTTAEPKSPSGTPMLYARLNDAGSAFEPQRNLIIAATVIDGGGAIAAVERTVYVAWHGLPPSADEAGGAVYVARSDDDGTTFTAERAVSVGNAGACACCGMSVLATSPTQLALLYRSAGANIHRDTTLLTSTDSGRTFAASTLHPWELNGCPLTTNALTRAGRGFLAAWETDQQVFVQPFDAGGSPVGDRSSPPDAGSRHHPVVAQSSGGATLLAFTVGTAWARGGTLGWQLFDRAMKPIAAAMREPGVPVWGTVAAVAGANDRFLLFY